MDTKEKKNKKGTYIICFLVFVLIIAFILYWIILKKQEKYLTSKPQIFRENNFTVVFQNEKINFCNYNKVDYFLQTYQEIFSFDEMKFDDLYMSKDSCPGTLKKIGNHFLFSPSSKIMEQVKDEYVLNELPSQVKPLSEEGMYPLKDGFFLYGYDQEEITSIYLLKYRSDNTLQWYQKIKPVFDNPEQKPISFFHVMMNEIIEIDDKYAVLYMLNYDIEEEETHQVYCLATFDKQGNFLDNKTLFSSSSSSSLTYLGVLNNQFLFCAEDFVEEQLRHVQVNLDGEQALLFQSEITDESSNRSISFNDENYIYHLYEKEKDDGTNMLSLNKLDMHGNPALSLTIEQGKDIEPYSSYSIKQLGNNLFLICNNFLYIYDKEGKFLKKEAIHQEGIQIDYDRDENYYYFLTSDLIGNKYIQILDQNFEIKSQIQYNQPEEVVTFLNHNHLYTSSFKQMREKKYQVLSIYTFE